MAYGGIGNGVGAELAARRTPRAIPTVPGRAGPSIHSLGQLGQQAPGPGRELPESIQERVRRGEIVAHAAEKYLVPFARANQQACLRLVEGVGSLRLSSRDMAVLYASYRDGNAITRQRLLEVPLLFLKAFKESLASPPPSSVEENLRTISKCWARSRDGRTGGSVKGHCKISWKENVRSWRGVFGSPWRRPVV